MSVRLRKGTEARLRHLGIKTSEEVRKYLEGIAWKAEAKRTLDKLEIVVRKYSKPSKAGFAVKSVRDDRDVGH